MERYLEIMVPLSESVMKSVQAAFPGGGLTMTFFPVGNKTSLSWKPGIADKTLLWITILKSWSLSNFYNKKQQILINITL